MWLAKQFTLPEPTEWSRGLRRSYEREALGLYVSDHPLIGLEGWRDANTDYPIGALAEMTESDPDTYADPGAPMELAGVLNELHRHISRNGFTRASARLDDLTGVVQVMFFGRALGHNVATLAEDIPIIIKGKLKREEETNTLIASSVTVPSEKDLEPWLAGQ